jgi:aldose 1-epimerase
VQLTYTLSEENELIIEYQANSSEDTIVNLTHHSYFNLDGHKSDILEQELIVNSRKDWKLRMKIFQQEKILNNIDSSFDFSSPKNVLLELTPLLFWIVKRNLQFRF